MATSPEAEVVRHLRRAMLPREGADGTDGELLEDFVSRRDRAALEALVRRHGPMVWGVCRRVLRAHHDAEDAFQATFLVLVRKAASIRSPELVANWLYGVAHQTALKARGTAAKRRRRERQPEAAPEPAAPERNVGCDLRPVLDEEVSRLPDKYRAVVVLCDLEGVTRKDAARQLGCPEGTVAGRLARARAMLAGRLTQRGVAVPGGLLAAVLPDEVVSAGVPASAAAAIRTADLIAAIQAAAAGVIPVKVAALADGVLKAMFLTKVKTTAAMSAALLALAALAYTMVAAAPPASVGGGAPPAGRPGTGDRRGAVDEPPVVRADPQKLRVRPREAFELTLRVINSSQAPRSFRVMNCSWFEQWKSSNPRVDPIGWDCAKNGEVTETLRAGQAYEKKLSMQLASGEPGEKVVFRLGFTPVGGGQTYWSNEVIVEADTAAAAEPGEKALAEAAERKNAEEARRKERDARNPVSPQAGQRPVEPDPPLPLPPPGNEQGKEPEALTPEAPPPVAAPDVPLPPGKTPGTAPDPLQKPSGRADDKKGAPGEIRDSLEGQWKVDSVDFVALPNRHRPSAWEFRRDRLILSDPFFGAFASGRMRSGTFRLGKGAKKPGRGEVAPIDVTLPLAAEPGVEPSKPRYVTFKGVYAWDGDRRLKFCFRKGDGDRPAALPEHATPGLISFELGFQGVPKGGASKGQVEVLKKKYAGRIKLGQVGAVALKSAEAMKALVEDPIWNLKGGVMVEQLEDVVGAPAARDPSGSVSYRFDTGFGGRVWVFSVEDYRVTGWEVKQLE